MQRRTFLKTLTVCHYRVGSGVARAVSGTARLAERRHSVTHLERTLRNAARS